MTFTNLDEIDEPDDDELGDPGLDDGEELVETEDGNAFDVRHAADLYSRASPAAREAVWAAMTVDERQQLAAFGGFTGPLDAKPDPDWQSLPYGHELYKSTVQRAEQEVRQGLADVRAGRLELTGEAQSRIEDAAARADQYPDSRPERGALLQEAAHLIESARAEIDPDEFEEGPYNEVNVRQIDMAGTIQITETDNRKRTRVTIRTPEQQAQERQAARAGEADPWNGDPSSVTLEAFDAMTHKQQIKFIRENPDVVRDLQAQASIRMSYGTAESLTTNGIDRS